MKSTGAESEVFCPKCRRYVGTFERCPYCRSKVPTRFSYRFLKWGGLTVAVLGVIFLYVDLHGPRLVVRPVPTVGISEIGPTMNYAQVYITGKATFVKYDEETRALGMFLSDENGVELFIRAYDTETLRLLKFENKRLMENDNTPRFPGTGDIITVRGNLRIRPDFNMMIVSFAEGVTIDRPEASIVTIENMVENSTAFGIYERLQIEGKIIDIATYDWSTILTVYEISSGAEASVLIPNILTDFLRPFDASMGDMIRVRGAFGMYYGSPQLWLASWDDFEVIG